MNIYIILLGLWFLLGLLAILALLVDNYLYRKSLEKPRRKNSNYTVVFSRKDNYPFD